MKKIKYVSTCCVCGKIRRHSTEQNDDAKHLDEWGHHMEEMQRYFSKYELVASHGYCNKCFEEAIEEMRILEKERL